jgi:hypothetical protein
MVDSTGTNIGLPSLWKTARGRREPVTRDNHSHSVFISANQQPTIAATHAATMAQQQHADNTRGWQSATGNLIFNNIQPPNPNVIPNPTMQQMETIEKAIKILNNHQLLMKFATENKQVSETKLVDQITFYRLHSLVLMLVPVYPGSSPLLGENCYSTAHLGASMTCYDGMRSYGG